MEALKVLLEPLCGRGERIGGTEVSGRSGGGRGIASREKTAQVSQRGSRNLGFAAGRARRGDDATTRTPRVRGRRREHAVEMTKARDTYLRGVESAALGVHLDGGADRSGSVREADANPVGIADAGNGRAGEAHGDRGHDTARGARAEGRTSHAGAARGGDDGDDPDARDGSVGSHLASSFTRASTGAEDYRVSESARSVRGDCDLERPVRLRS